MKTALLDQSRIIELEERNSKTVFPTSFEFLKSHAGLRKGELHSLIATTGASKSTLAKSVIIQTAVKSNVLVVLTEEEFDQYSLSLNKEVRNLFNSTDIADEILNRISIVHERKDFAPTNIDEGLGETYVQWLVTKIAQTNADVVFYDNVTTGFSNEIHISKQSQFAKQLVDLPKEFNIAMVLIFHTTKKLKPGPLVTVDDCRGTMIYVNASAYAYTLTMYYLESVVPTEIGGKAFLIDRVAVLQVAKARFHSSQGYIYELIYNPDIKLYTADRKINKERYIQILEASGFKKGAK